MEIGSKLEKTQFRNTQNDESTSKANETTLRKWKSETWEWLTHHEIDLSETKN